MPPPHPPAAGRLAGAPVVLLALAVTAPLAVVSGVVPAGYAAGLTAEPLLFAGLGLLLLTFASGYLAAARRMPHPGPLYSVVARGLGRPLGLAAAWLALLSYATLQLACYGLAGAAAAPLLDTWFGVGVPWWAVAAGCWAVVAGCGLVRGAVTAWLIAVLVLGETVVIVGYGAANLLHPSGAGSAWTTVSPAALADVPRPVLGLLLVGAALSFVGFETAAGYGDQTRHPRRATYLCVVLTTVLTGAAAWAMGVAAGPDRIVALAGARGPELMVGLAADRLAPWAVTLGRVTLVTGLLAAALALHQVIVRHLVALGRERVLPAAFGRTPAVASLAQSAVLGAALGGCAYAGLVPGRGLGTAGGLGILAVLTATSLAALLFLNRSPNGEGAWQRLFAPTIGTVGLGVLGYLAARDLPALLGVPMLRVWIGLAAAGAAVLAGLGSGLALRRTAPVVYAGIGLGGAAVVVTPTLPALPRQRLPGAHRPERVGGEELTGPAGSPRRRTPGSE
ncbi:APC family permease [Actinoplanes sp. NPDC049599]|uniref:APC family permease n=1 Tax=Actinoplanes sp. NPDC049599 TaxID=3363903 RepID=UPI0037BBA407